MATTNNLHVPEDPLAQMQRRAEPQGRTADEAAEEALKRYLAHEALSELSAGSEEGRRLDGLRNDDEVERYVDQVIHSHRDEHHSR